MEKVIIKVAKKSVIYRGGNPPGPPGRIMPGGGPRSDIP